MSRKKDEANAPKREDYGSQMAYLEATEMYWGRLADHYGKRSQKFMKLAIVFMIISVLFQLVSLIARALG